MFLRKRLAISDHFEGLWSVGTRFRQLRQSQALNKKLAMSPSSTMFMAASMILNMCHSSSYCMRHSWRTYSRGDKLEPARSSVEHMARLVWSTILSQSHTRPSPSENPSLDQRFFLLGYEPSHVEQKNQILVEDHDLDHLAPSLPLCDAVPDLCSTDPIQETCPILCRLYSSHTGT